jgi:hypothetical protein
VIYQAVAKHILTQCISAGLLLLLLVFVFVFVFVFAIVVVVSYFLVDSSNIWYACKLQKMVHQ